MNVKLSSRRQSKCSVESISFFVARVRVREPFLERRNMILIDTALVGTVEELSASQQTLNLVRDQFEINYFGPLNIIKASLPHMRKETSGHIMIISGISKFSVRSMRSLF